MISTKNKLIATIFLFLLFLLLTGIHIDSRTDKIVSPKIEAPAQLNGTKMGGVIARMPDGSVRILFEGMLGVKLGSYQAYDSVDEVLTALRRNEIQSAWFSDVTAKYLMKTQKGFKKIDLPKPEESRLEFAFALKKSDTELQKTLSEALQSLKTSGILKQLTDYYVDGTLQTEMASEKEMVVNTKAFQDKTSGKPLYVGVSGAVPPLDAFDLENRPSGFSIQLMDEIGQIIKRKVEFIVVKNDAAFSSLMAGKIDLIFCYGTSQNTMVDAKEYIMTDGYYTMEQYSFLVLE